MTTFSLEGHCYFWDGTRIVFCRSMPAPAANPRPDAILPDSQDAWVYYAREGWALNFFLPPLAPCLYLGEVLNRLGCLCPARWVRKCAVHGTCTLEVCKTCPDHESAG